MDRLLNRIFGYMGLTVISLVSIHFNHVWLAVVCGFIAGFQLGFDFNVYYSTRKEAGEVSK